MKDFKHIVGSVASGKPATIRFYGEVNQWNCMYFNYEMMWLQEQNPSQINIMINSEGGNVIHGMSTYSVIQDCNIKTVCIIEGIAASMGSVLWAAGDERKMRDYSILMMHNPYYSGDDSKDDQDPALKAFTNQLRSVYTTKFGLSESDIKNIMDGKDGEDGTWLDHKSAIKHGIIAKEDVIQSSKGACKKIKNLISAKSSVRDICNNITKELIDMQPSNEDAATIKTEENKIINNKNMELLATVASLLGLSKDTDQSEVLAKISSLGNVKSEIEEVKAKLGKEQEAKNALEIKLAGETAKVDQANAKIKEYEAALKEYKDKEEQEFKASCLSLVEKAISEGKILDSAKDQFVTMAETNFELTKSVLDGIKPADKITNEINKDDKKIEEASKTELEKMQAKVNEILGDKFEFKTLDK